MLFLDVEGEEAQLKAVEEALTRQGYLADGRSDARVILLSFTLPDHPGALLPVLEETLRQLELLRREGVGEKEFREAKNQLRGSYLLGLESPGGRMQSMGRGQLHLGQCMTPEETIAKIEAVTQADVNAVAERIFAAEPCLSVVGKNASVYLAR